MKSQIKISKEFKEVSIEMPSWHDRFTQLIRERKAITYNTHKMPTFPKAIEEELNKTGYSHGILEAQPDQHLWTPPKL